MEVKNNKTSLVLYGNLLSDIKTRIRQAQVKATLSANAEMVAMYWDVGKMIYERQQHEGWGTGVIPRLAKDIRNELPKVKGFSERNIGYMIRFAREYGDPVILQQAVAKLPVNEHSVIVQRLVVQIPRGHNILLMERVKDLSVRFWYMEQTIQNSWSRDTLGLMIKSGAHLRQGKSVSNFSLTLPDPQSDLARQSLKDPYIFDFLTLTEPFNEREIETALIKHLEKFLLELGAGFSFVGRQYQLTISDEEIEAELGGTHEEGGGDG